MRKLLFIVVATFLFTLIILSPLSNTIANAKDSGENIEIEDETSTQPILEEDTTNTEDAEDSTDIDVDEDFEEDEDTPVTYKVLPKKRNVPIDKEWSIQLNTKLDVQTVTRDNVYVVDDKGIKQKTNAFVTKDQTKIMIYAPKDNYRKNSHYTLYVTTSVASKNEKFLETPIKMEFKTSDKKEMTFVVNPKKNKVIYTKKVQELPAKTLKKITTKNYKENKITFDGKLKDVKKLSKDKIFILPPTKEYPFGYAKKVTSVAYKKNSTVVNVKEPKLEEVVNEKSTISAEQNVEFANLGIDTNKVAGLYLKTASVDKKVYVVKGEEDKKITIDYNKDKKTIRVEYVDIKLKEGSEENIGGHKVTYNDITLNGSITLKAPKLNTEGPVYNLSYLHFESDILKDLTVTYSAEVEGCSDEKCKLSILKTTSKEKVIPTGLKIPITIYGVVGVNIGIDLVGEMSLSGSVTTGFDFEGKIDVGFKENAAGGKNGFNRSDAKVNMKIFKLEAKAEVSGAARIFIRPQIAQFEVAEIAGDVGVKMELTGEAEKTLELSSKNDKDSSEESGVEFSESTVCARVEAVFFVELTGEIGTKKINISVDIAAIEKPLYEVSTCDIKSLKVSPEKLELSPGEEKKITLKAITKVGQEVELALPDKEIKMNVKKSSIASVDRYGKLTIKNSAKVGDTTTLHIKYKDIEKNVSIKVVKKSAEDTEVGDKAKEINPYKQSYLITNSSDETLVLRTEKMDYITYESDSKSLQSYSTNTTLFSLKKGETGIISYREVNPLHPKPTIISGKGTIQPYKKGAFIAHQLLQNQSVEIETTGQNSVRIYPEGVVNKGYVQWALYDKDSNNSGLMKRHQFTKTSSNVIYLSKSENLIVSNVLKDTPVVVFTPNVSSIKTEVTDEMALKEYVLHSREIGNFSAVNAKNIAKSMLLEVASLATSHVGNYSVTQYSKTVATANVTKNTTNASYPSRNINVLNNGDVVVENTGKEDLIIYGPAREIKFNKTTEKPFLEYDLAPGKQVKVTSSLKDALLGLDGKIDGNKLATYNVDIIRLNPTSNVSYKNIKVGDPLQRFKIYGDGETVITNTSESTLHLYGPSRYLTFNG